ncbi:hypothetical protein BDV93DRAFT_543587 [Ceratobasidium sp. AG-I]|nr:hypothetical protein BDV93DRAFT_543587 [Ceratobasidium sp. AG-I]
MQPKPIPLSDRRRNAINKASPATGSAPLYPAQMTLPGAGLNYIASSTPASSMANPTRNMAGQPPQLAAGSQRPYLAAEMNMMQDALKNAALKTAETIRYMSTVQRVKGSFEVKAPPPAVTNELRLQLARYDQLCDIVETRLVRAHATLSARLERERAANPQQSAISSQNQPIQIDSPMSDDVPLSLSKAPALAPPASNLQYTPAPKSKGLASLARPRTSQTTADPTQTLSPVTLASNAAILPTMDLAPSHHAVVPGLLEALRKQELEQARTALHRPQDQETAGLDIFGGTAGATMDDLFMSDTNPGGLDINSAVAAIDNSVGALGPSVADINSAVSAMHSAVPDMDSAVAELDSAVAEMAAAGDLDPLDPRTNDALFGDLHTNPRDGAGFDVQPAQDAFTNGSLQSRGFAGENLAVDDPFVTGDIPPGDGFPSVSGTGEDGSKGDDLLAELDAAGPSDMDLQMDLMGIEGLGMGASAMGQTGVSDQDNGMGLGEGGMDLEGGMNLGGVDIPGGDMGMNDVGIEGIGMDGEIEAMWSNIPMDNFFSGMDGDMGVDLHIKTEED